MNTRRKQTMTEFLDERRYAWRLIRAARQDRDDAEQSRERLASLLEAALDAGLDRATLITELAQLGGRLLALCDPAPGDPALGDPAGADEVCLT